MRKSLRFSLALATLVVVGCGGSGSYTYTPPAITGSSDTPTPTTTVTTTVPASTTTVQTPTVTYNDPVTGTPTTAPVALPAGETLNAGEQAVLIPLNFPVPIDIDLLPQISKPTTSQPRQATTPGEIWLSRDGGATWHDTHLTVNGIKIQGTLGAQYVALPARGTSLDIEVDGPFHLGSNASGARLDVSTELDIHYDKFGINSFPRRVTYAFPANGGLLTQSNVNVYYPTLFNTSGGGVSEISYGAIDKTFDANIASDHLTFLDPSLDKPADEIPGTGIDFVAFSLDTTTKSRHRH